MHDMFDELRSHILEAEASGYTKTLEGLRVFSAPSVAQARCAIMTILADEGAPDNVMMLLCEHTQTNMMLLLEKIDEHAKDGSHPLTPHDAEILHKILDPLV